MNAEHKSKLVNELTEYFFNVLYFAIFFGLLAWYRHLILAQYKVDYFDFGASIIEALILSKVIMTGEMMRMGNGLKNKALIYTTIYKSLVFTLLVGLFTIIESALRGLFSGVNIVNSIAKLMDKQLVEIVARNLIIFCALIPFFAFKELQRILGQEKIKKIFWGEE